jgi:hypothetical protein
MTGNAFATSEPTTRSWRAKLGKLLRGDGAIVLIMLLFAILGAIYSVTTPLFETPDEPFHYRYVKWIADGKGLPPLLISEDEWEQGEFHQPPLYYIVSALLTSHIDTGSADDICEFNTHAAWGLADLPGNKNAVLHLQEDRFPYQGISRAVHILRWFGILCSTLTVYVTWRIALEIVPQRRNIALGAAALTALNPQFIFISAGVNNDTWVSLWASLILYLCVRVCKGQARPYVTPIALGIVAGVAGLSKLSGLASAALVPLAYLLYFRVHKTRGLWKSFVRPMLVVAGLVLLISGWWYGRNALVYGDPLGMRSYYAIFSVHKAPLSLGETLRTMLDSFVSYWSVFGWMNVVPDKWFYAFYFALSLFAAIGLALLYMRTYAERTHRTYVHQGAVAILLVWVLIMLALLFRWTRTITRTQGRLLFPAISALSFFLSIGLLEWTTERFAGRLVAGVATLMFVLSLLAPFLYIAPAYALPDRITLEEVPNTLSRLDISFGDELFLIGYQVPQQDIRAGGRGRFRLFWLAKKEVKEDYTIFVHLFGRDGKRIGGADTYPGGGMYPTRRWNPGEVIVDDYLIDIAPDAEAPGPGLVRIGVYEKSTMEHLQGLDTQGREIGHDIQIARVRIGPARETHYRPPHEMEANFGHKVMLIGYELSPEMPMAGETWEVALYWDTLARMDKDYTVFLHLFNDAGERVTQVDEQPLRGGYPTHLWHVRDQVRDVHLVPLPQDLPQGEYQLHIGLYFLQTGERLDVIDTEPPTSTVVLGPIHIQANTTGSD